MALWPEGDPAAILDWRVEISTEGPLDQPGSGQVVDVTDRVSAKELSIKRGRNDEREHFGAGTCTFALRNDDRAFDPTRTRVCLDLPGTTGDTATTDDLPAFAIAGDLEVWAELSMDTWHPGGFGSIVMGQWPAGSGNNGWFYGVGTGGYPTFSFTTNGSTLQGLVSATQLDWAPGSVHWFGARFVADNGAGGHGVTFWTRDIDGTPVQIGATVPGAGTVSIFDSSGPLQFGGVLPFAGQIYRAELRDGIGGAPVARPDFTVLRPGVDSFTDRDGAVWSINGTGVVAFDRHASPYAPILDPLRRVQVIFAVGGVDYPLFTGFVEGWPQTWTPTTGTVEIAASDITTVLAQMDLADVGFVLDDDTQGILDENPLSGDVPQQFAGQRAGSLVAMAGVPGPTAIDRGLVLMPEIAGDPDEDAPLSGSVISMIHDAETAEAGFFFVAADGTVTFRDKHSRIDHQRMRQIQATLTDCEYRDIFADLNLAQIRNDVTYSRPDGAPQIATDEDSIDRYGHWAETDTLQVIADGEAYARAEFDVWRYSRPKVRPSPVDFYPRRDMAAMAPLAAALELLDRVAIERQPRGGPGDGPIGELMRWVGLVEQIEHRLTQDDWKVTVATSLLDLDSEDDYLILDDDVASQLDAYDLIF